MTTPARVTIGLSGGVDSAVAAFVLQRAGYDVRAVFMKNWSEEDFGGPCPWAEDQASAIAVANHLGIPLETWNFEREYRQRVFETMIAEYRHGRTPNPDILCNQEIKFRLFFERALTTCDLIATGHYAQTEAGKLLRATDEQKDQSYFLSRVSSQALKKTLFPIGHLKKTEVREMAREAGLPNWDRPDSVGICFVGEKDMDRFLEQYLPKQPGEIQLIDGRVVGMHRGLQFYTIGQRHGFGRDLDQSKVAAALGSMQPMVVTEKRVASNTLVIAPRHDTAQTEQKEFLVRDMHWISYACSFPWSGTAKLRYRQPDVAVTVLPEGDAFRVICQAPQRAITPGQYAVFYRDQECLGSAVISE